MTEQKQVFNLEEAAQFLGMAVCSLRNAVKAGSIPCKIVGRRYLFSREALLAWLR